MSAVAVIHRSKRKAFAQFNPRAKGHIELPIPFRIIQTAVKRSAQPGYIFTYSCEVGLLALRRTNAI